MKSQAKRRESEWSHEGLVSDRRWMSYLSSECNSSWQMWNLGNEHDKSRIFSTKLWSSMNSMILGHSPLCKDPDCPGTWRRGGGREQRSLQYNGNHIGHQEDVLFCSFFTHFLHRRGTGEWNPAIHTCIIRSLHWRGQGCQEKQQSEYHCSWARHFTLTLS